MSSSLVALCYGSALVVALACLWYFGVKSWFWHLASIVAAFVIGLIPIPAGLNTVEGTLAVGWVFTFLFAWGAVAPVLALANFPPYVGHHKHR